MSFNTLKNYSGLNHRVYKSGVRSIKRCIWIAKSMKAGFLQRDSFKCFKCSLLNAQRDLIKYIIKELNNLSINCYKK